ncbi:MAG TPA: LLM class flavin-dependent oxidoreductase [Candidatus Limnocylindrales bacterium]|nr:LLM class flavin-dependent oxidoreductase [Candidatus Limnocylindrales bacterium]
MRFALMLEPQQGLTYEQQLAAVRRAEAGGFESFFRSDHYAGFPGDGDGPTTDAWAVLAGIARETKRISLGTLVSPVTFRHPGNLVKLVTTVDQMSGGRVEIGVGAGWNDDDHGPLGLPFPEISERADLMEDQLAILHGILTEPDGWSFEGHQVRVTGSRLRPRAVQVPGRPTGATGIARPRILMGGDGSPRSFRLAARYADEFNLSGASPERAVEKFGALDETLRAAGRDPATMVRSVMVGTVIGATPSELEARVTSLMDAFGLDGARREGYVESRRARMILGTPDEARAMVARYAGAGVQRLMLQDFLPLDLGMIDLMAAELVTKA